MQPRHENRRHGLIGTVPLALLLAACSTAAATTTHSSFPAPTPTATATPTQIPAPTPTAAPTPAPEPPLAVLSQGLELKVVNAQGAEQWELTNANLAQIFGVSVPQITNEVTANWPVNSVQVEEAGPNLVLFYNAGTGPTKVAVISHAGKLIGTSSIPDYNLNGDFYVSSPDGTQWAWSVDQSPANQINNLGPGSTYRHHGVVEVAGTGEPVHTVYQWLAPAGFTEELHPQDQAIEVVNGQGVEQWGLTSAQMGQYFGLTAKQSNQLDASELTYDVGGSHLLFFYLASPTLVKVVVVSRTGQVLGRGTAPGMAYWGLVVSPDGTSWAWSDDQTPNATGRHHGVIEVGGLGEANRIVYSWVAPVGYTESLAAWTNTRIIMDRTQGPGPCGSNLTTAWFVINPTTGKLSDLFTGNDQFLDASSGVATAGLLNDAHAVLVNGVIYSETKSLPWAASISPDGTHVAIARVANTSACSPSETAKETTEMVTVASRTHTDLNLNFVSWWNNTEILANGPGLSFGLYTLQGQAVSEILPVNTPWLFAAVLS